MNTPPIRLTFGGAIASITIDRPAQRNALTMAMYDEVIAACRRIQEADHRVALVTIQGSGGAFAAGTDISEFSGFQSGADGVRYEARIETVLSAIEALPVVTCAVVDGPAMGGGCLIAASCDFRVVTPRAKFGAPMARTLGNCLSARNIARLVASVGYHTARRMLLLAQMVDANEALRSGLALSLVESSDIDAEVARLATTLELLAPLTLRATKEVLGGLVSRADIPDQDIINRVYASADFKAGVDAFVNRKKPVWQGR